MVCVKVKGEMSIGCFGQKHLTSQKHLTETGCLLMKLKKFERMEMFCGI